MIMFAPHVYSFETDVHGRGDSLGDVMSSTFKPTVSKLSTGVVPIKQLPEGFGVSCDEVEGMRQAVIVICRESVPESKIWVEHKSWIA
jgi:hypothetical protein